MPGVGGSLWFCDATGKAWNVTLTAVFPLFNHNRLQSMIGNIPPVEREDLYYRHTPPAAQPLAGEPSLH